METAAKQDGENARVETPRLFASVPRFLLFVAGYFVLQIVLRLIASNSADLDESEQLLGLQQMQLGYGPQPPLYTWLLFPLAKATGANIFSLAVFKDALLFGTYAVTYACARMIFRDPLRCAVAALSLLFLPQIAWESQRDLTHSVLVTFLVMTTFLIFLKLRRSPRWQLYVAFGLCLGAGILAKYSFLVFAVGLLVGGMVISSFRKILLNPLIALSLVVCGLVITPHVTWAVQHADWVMATSAKLKIATHDPWLKSCFVGLKNLLLGVSIHLLPITAIFFLIAGKRLAKEETVWRDSDAVKLIQTSLLAILGLLIFGILIFKVNGFKDRWFTPLCVWISIFLVAIFSPWLNPIRLKRLVWIAGTVALVVSVLIPTRVWMAKTLNFPQVLNVDFEKLSAQLPPANYIVASDDWIGGNLKLCFPDCAILSPRMFLEMKIPPDANGLLIWDARKADALPSKLLNYARQFTDVDTNEIRFVEAPLKFWPEKTTKLGFATIRFKSDAASILQKLRQQP